MTEFELGMKHLREAKENFEKSDIDEEAKIIIDELVNQLSGESKLVSKKSIDSDKTGQYICIRRDEYKHGLQDSYAGGRFKND